MCAAPPPTPAPGLAPPAPSLCFQPHPNALSDSPHVPGILTRPSLHCAAPSAAGPEEPLLQGSANIHFPGPFRCCAGCDHLGDRAQSPSPVSWHGRLEMLQLVATGRPESLTPSPCNTSVPGWDKEASSEQTLIQRRHTNSQQAHENRPNIIGLQGNANQNNESCFTPTRMAMIKKR